MVVNSVSLNDDVLVLTGIYFISCTIAACNTHGTFNTCSVPLLYNNLILSLFYSFHAYFSNLLYICF